MQFTYNLIEHFPPLAWVAAYQADLETINVLHGRFVETHPYFFVEGAWAGDFSEGQIKESDTVFGSGGVMTDNAVTFVSCTATTDFLYYNDDINRFVISNSLPLLLAFLGDALKPACKDYGCINMSILDGLRKYHSKIPTQRSHVQRVMHSNVEIRARSIALADKPLPPVFMTFDEYRDFMLSRIAALFGNARNPSRRKPMQIFSTQSKGYDSTAVNALCAAHGIDKVFTSPQSKEVRSFYLGKQTARASDDGTQICNVLGLECIYIDRLGFQQSPTGERYYWAGLNNNQDFNLHQIHAFITHPTLLLTGNYGELWYTQRSLGSHLIQYVDDDLRTWGHAGWGLSEARLHAGFVQTAIPFLGARHRKLIFGITESKEMAPWRLGNDYDRPIPRRIAEEAGVPRQMFGQVKLASIVHLPSPNIPVTPVLRAEFFEHLGRHHLLGRAGIWILPIVHRLNNWIYWNNPDHYFNNRRKNPLLWYLGYVWSRLLGHPLRIRMLLTQLDSYLYAFCVNKVRDEYTAHLASMKLSGGASNMVNTAISSAANQKTRGH